MQYEQNMDIEEESQLNFASPEMTLTAPKRKTSELKRAASASTTHKKKSKVNQRQSTISIDVDGLGSGPIKTS